MAETKELTPKPTEITCSVQIHQHLASKAVVDINKSFVDNLR